MFEIFATLVALKGLCPVCVVMLLCRWPEEARLYLHWLHLYGFSPVCLCLMCIFKSPVVMLEYSHIVHLWGFSPEWVLLCLFRWPDWIVVKSHWLHWCQLSPVCFIRCSFKWATWLVEKLHCAHLCGFSPVWVRKCLFRLTFWLNDLLHWEQWSACKWKDYQLYQHQFSDLICTYQVFKHSICHLLISTSSSWPSLLLTVNCGD